MPEVMVSICCEVYNHERYIRQSLEGFITQKTEYAFEVLVHDDASTDRSAQIIREYEEKYPHVMRPIYQAKNQYSKGTPIMTSIQIPRAKGKYIAFCEGDDYWCDPHKLQKQISFLESHPEYSASVHNVLTVDVDDNPLFRNSFGTEDYDIDVDESMKFPQTSSYVMRNPLLDQSDEGKKIFSAMIGSDKSFMLYMAKTGKIRFFADYMSHYRLVISEGDSHSARKRRINMTEQRTYVEHALYRQIQEYGMDLDISKHVFQNSCIYSFMFCVRHRNRENYRLFMKTIKSFPYSKWRLFPLAVRYLFSKVTNS